MKCTVVYVHGAFISDSRWWWQQVGKLLDEKDIESRTIDLPSCGEKGPLGDIAADTRAVTDLLDTLEGPVVLVGHSYGGAIISGAAEGRSDVRHLLYISAVVPDDTSVADCGFADEEEIPELDIRDDGTVSEGNQRFKTKVLESLPDPEMTDEAVARLTRQSVASFTDIIPGKAWKTHPNSYIICQYDADVPVSAQRIHAARAAGAVHEVPTNHFAHLERPDLVAEVITDVVASWDEDLTPAG